MIAPLSTIGNWQREFEEWTDINAIVYHGSLNSRNCIQQYEMHYKNENVSSKVVITVELPILLGIWIHRILSKQIHWISKAG